MAATWVQLTPYTDGAGTTATSLVGPNLVIGAIGGGAAWVGTSPKEGFDINDNLSFTCTSTQINTWFNGRTSMAMGIIVNDARSAQKCWQEVTGSGNFGSTANNSFRFRVSSTGVITWSLNTFPGGVGTTLDMVISSAGAVSANTDTYLLGVFDSTQASADRARVYVWGVRLTPETYNAPDASYALTFIGAGAKLANGGDTNNGETIVGAVYWHELATVIPDDAEIEDRSDQLALDNDAEPTSGGAAISRSVTLRTRVQLCATVRFLA